MDLYTIDAETFYSKEFSLSRLTTEEYVRDPRFELIGLSIKKNDKKTKWLSGDILEVYAALQTIDWSGAAILAHNTMFDGAILAWRLGIKPKLWLDTLSMSRAIHGPDASHGLAALAKRYNLPPKGDEVLRAIGMQRADFTPRQLASYGGYCKHDTDLCYQLFNIFVGQVPKKELQLIDMTLRMFTEPQLQLNKAKLEAHLAETIRAKQALLDRVGTDKKQLMSGDKFAALLQEVGVDPPRKVSPTTGKEVWAFAKTDEDFKALLEHDNTDVQALVAARLGNKSTLEETRTTRFLGIESRGLLPCPIRYYAAHTGRWGGDDKINLQNLPSRGPNAKRIKEAIEAPPGYVIVEADSSQIEARVLAWFAEQRDMLETFRNKEDPYKKMAALIYGVREDEVTKDQRQVGKGVVLGCGFGMGPDKFQVTMKGVYGIFLELEECRRIIRIYRAANPRIVQLWKDAGHMLTYLTRETAYHFGKPGVLEVEPARLGIRLPSGLYIQYPDLQAHQTTKGWQFDYAGRGTSRKKVYGALVVENCLAGDTEVLTPRGWVPIVDIQKEDSVWDGAEWVSHSGLIYQGIKDTTVINGVRMTPDHNILTERGWRCASSCEGLHRAGFWMPDGSEVSGDKWTTLALGLPMQVWDEGGEGSRQGGKERPPRAHLLMRMRAWCEERVTRNVQSSCVLGVAVNEGPVQVALPPSVAQLWRAGHSGLRRVGKVLRGFLGGHGPYIPPGTDAGPHGQRRPLQPRELPVGYAIRASRKQEDFPPGGSKNSSGTDGYFQIDTELPMEPRAVYDLLNAGPNSRFVVRGSPGPFIVHNCVQALARIIVAEQMLRIKKKHRIALTVHDSALIVVPKAEEEEAKAYVETCMRWVPAWATGLPVDCEVGSAQNYGDT